MGSLRIADFEANPMSPGLLCEAACHCSRGSPFRVRSSMGMGVEIWGLRV